jgi:ParB family chromosome partitioning protein
VEFARKIIQAGYSVRQAEVMVSRYGENGTNGKTEAPEPAADPNVKAAIHALEQALGTKVTIQESGGKGRIELHFYSHEEMHRLYDGLLKARF